MNWRRCGRTSSRRADGTPFFLEEFARSLHESGAIAGGAPRLTNIVIPARCSPYWRRASTACRRCTGASCRSPRSSAGTSHCPCSPPSPTCTSRPWRRRSRLLRGGRVPGRGQPADRHRLQLLACADAGRRHDTLLRSDRRGCMTRLARHRDTEPVSATAPSTIWCTMRSRRGVARGRALRAGRRRAREPSLGLTEAKAYLETVIAAWADSRPASPP